MYTRLFTSCLLLAFASLPLAGQISISLPAELLLCQGDFAEIQPEITGGDGTYTYAWSPALGLSATTIANPVASPAVSTTYTLLVTDGQGLEASESIDILRSPQILFTGGIDQQICAGESATLSVNAAGGVTFEWSTGETIENIVVAPAVTTTYVVTVTGPDGCTETGESTVTVNPNPELEIVPTDATCNLNNGMAVVAINGGTSPFAYEWSNGAPTATITGLAAGTYVVTVTDANGCSGIGETIIGDSSDLIVDAGPDVTICAGQSTTLTTTAFGGVAPYTYEWSPSTATAALTVSPSVTTTYSVMVTDNNNCSSTDQVTVVVTPSFEVEVTSTPVACGNSDGTATAIANGGQAPYAYLWSTGATTETVTDLIPGIYNVVVTDANGCTQTTVTSVGEEAPEIVSASVNNVDCNGAFTGSISLLVTNGTPGYTYAWTGPSSFTASTADITNLPAGTYTVVVTDANGCSDTESFELTEPAVLEISASTIVQDAACNGEDSGSIDLAIISGTPGYTYTWTGPNSFSASTADIASLPTGTYTVTVTDSNGCSDTESFTIGEPSLLEIDFESTTVTNTDCGESNGTIDLVVIGGIPPYTYQGMGPNTTSGLFTNLAVGAYSILVSDANGCFVEGVFTILEDTDLLVDLGPDQTFCEGETLTLTANASGGDGNYTYLWPTGETTMSINLTSDFPVIYSVNVTDGSGCSQSGQVSLSSELVLTGLAQDESCGGEMDGSITVETTGGTGSYTYNWSDIGDTGSTGNRSNLAEGLYTVTVSDGNCSTSLGFSVDGFSADDIIFTIASPTCFGSADGSISVENLGGIYTYLWNVGATTSTITGLPNGEYCVTITDENGCTHEACATIDDPAQLQLDIQGLPTESCATDYTLDGIVTGGTAPYAFSWTTPGGFIATSASITGTFEGLVQLQVMDANGCTVVVVVEINTIPIATSVAEVYLSCNTGMATLDGTGSTSGPDITYQWIGPAGFVSNQLIVETPLAGEYTLMVSHSSTADCEVSSTTTVIDISADFESGIDVALLACNDYRLTGITPLNYSGSITFAWVFPDATTSNEQTITPNQTGVYTLTTTAAGLGCQHHSTVFIDLEATDCITINGYIHGEEDENCTLDPNATTLSNVQVIASGPSGNFSVFTDAEGYYEMNVPIDVISVEVLEPSASWEACFSSIDIVGANPGDIIPASFWLKRLIDCPELSVNLSASLLRRCFTSLYCLRVCNEGSEIAENPTVSLVLDPFLSLSSTSLPPANQDGQFIDWEINSLLPGQCYTIYVWVDVSCDAQLGQTHCSEAYASPSPLCTPTNNWSGTNLELVGECEAGEVRFTVKNTGSDDLNETVQYIVIEDAVAMMNPVSINDLGGDQEETFGFPANGSTYTFQIQQVDNHPYSTNLSASVEGCGTNMMGNFSTGFVTQYSQITATPASDIFCIDNVGSFDPNDKAALPVGYGEQHYIVPETELFYRIRFQNTGTDTAFTVVIRDTLSESLDIRTLEPGNSSHNYELALTGERALTFTFNNILLPDSTTNLEASQGFVDFRIWPLVETPLETVIENSAAIYFDFNEPIVTNTVFHTLGRNFLEVVSVTTPSDVNINWNVFPNPVADQLQLQVGGDVPEKMILVLFDSQGRNLLQHTFNSEQTSISLADLAAGMYRLQLMDAESGQALGTASVVKR